MRVHAGDVVKESVPALLDKVTNVGKACTTSDISVLDFLPIFVTLPLLPRLTPKRLAVRHLSKAISITCVVTLFDFVVVGV